MTVNLESTADTCIQREKLQPFGWGYFLCPNGMRADGGFCQNNTANCSDLDPKRAWAKLRQCQPEADEPPSIGSRASQLATGQGQSKGTSAKALPRAAGNEASATRYVLAGS